MASVDYALQNNVGLSANYGFDWKTQDGTDKGDFYRADLNYKFIIRVLTANFYLYSHY